MNLSRPFEVVTPTLDGTVLAALAGAEAAFTPGQLHRLIGGHSIDGVRRVLNRLTAQGIVRAEPTSTSVLYSLNRQHLAAGPVIDLARLRDTLVARISERLDAWAHRPVYAALFGSAARGDMRADSDLDLLVVRPDAVPPDDEIWQSQLNELAADVTAWTGNDARVLEYGAAQARSASEPVLLTIAAQGLTLYGARDWLQSAARTLGARVAN